MLLHFTKMEGCGNDYVYVNGFTEHVPQEQKPDIVRKLSDRHFGIGGDGVIFINPSERADFEMEMYNADGSRGEMCGNGIRCVAKYVYDRGMTNGREQFDVESFGKVKHLELTCRDGKAVMVRVDMGEPVLEAAEIPAAPEHTREIPAPEKPGWIGTAAAAGQAQESGSPADVEYTQRSGDPADVEYTQRSGDPAATSEKPQTVLARAGVVDEPIVVRGREWRMTCVSMGNPHAVVFLSEEDLKGGRKAPWEEASSDHSADEGMAAQENGSGESGAHENGSGESTAQESGSRESAAQSESGLDIHNFDIAYYGPYFEHHKVFPNRVNTEFVQVIDREYVKIRVWERGTGETLACGTGTCATAVACVLNGKTDRKVEVEVLGGRIMVEWDEKTNHVFMTGPAREVFDGTVEI